MAKSQTDAHDEVAQYDSAKRIQGRGKKKMPREVRRWCQREHSKLQRVLDVGARRLGAIQYLIKG